MPRTGKRLLIQGYEQGTRPDGGSSAEVDVVGGRACSSRAMSRAPDPMVAAQPKSTSWVDGLLIQGYEQGTRPDDGRSAEVDVVSGRACSSRAMSRPPDPMVTRCPV